MRSIPVAFGLTVRMMRKHAGYSQESFADAIGLHRTVMGTLERGQGNPRLKTVVRIVGGLHVSLEEFFAAVETAGS